MDHLTCYICIFLKKVIIRVCLLAFRLTSFSSLHVYTATYARLMKDTFFYSSHLSLYTSKYLPHTFPLVRYILTLQFVVPYHMYIVVIGTAKIMNLFLQVNTTLFSST